MSTGRTCDGPQSTTIIVFQPKQQRSSTLSRLPPVINTLPWSNQPDEIRAYTFFLDRVAPTLSGALDGGLWSVLVPQVAQSDNAVAYAIFAISHLFEISVCKEECRVPSDAHLSQKHLTALSWYAKALSADKHQRKVHDTKTMLIKCTLFSSLEFQQDNFRAGIELLRIGYSIVAPLLTATSRSSYLHLSTDDIVETILPMGMRSAGLLFTSLDSLDTTIFPYRTPESPVTNVFCGLCTVYALLKDHYLGNKSGSSQIRHRLLSIQNQLRTTFLSWRQQTTETILLREYFSNQQALALRDYCEIALGWLGLLANFSSTKCIKLLTSILDFAQRLEAQAMVVYPAAGSTAFFRHMAIMPPLYLVVVLAPSLSLRNRALDLMNYRIIDRPNTQVHAMVTSLGADVLHMGPDKLYGLSVGEQQIDTDQPHDADLYSLSTNEEPRGANDAILGAEQSTQNLFKGTQLAVLAGDINGMYKQQQVHLI